MKFVPKVTGFFRILLDKPGPLVTPPLKIKIEYGEGVAAGELPGLEEQMLKSFRESTRVTPEFTWVAPDSLPRETKKTKLIEIVGGNP